MGLTLACHGIGWQDAMAMKTSIANWQYIPKAACWKVQQQTRSTTGIYNKPSRPYYFVVQNADTDPEAAKSTLVHLILLLIVKGLIL